MQGRNGMSYLVDENVVCHISVKVNLGEVHKNDQTRKMVGKDEMGAKNGESIDELDIK